MTKNKIIMPPEWHPQDAVQLTWPHEDSDWHKEGEKEFEEVQTCFLQIANAISKREKLIVVCKNKKQISHLLKLFPENIVFAEIDSNDSWARDHGGITIFKNEKRIILDFNFNGWGLKFRADKDNLITSKLYDMEIFSSECEDENKLGFVLEGGSIESDGLGTLLTTSSCLFSKNRNGELTEEEIINYLKNNLGAEKILMLNNGHLAGDDTDGHIDTLARFCNPKTIAYVKCTDEKDEHYNALKAMEDELKEYTTIDDEKYELVPLPMPEPICYKGERLPATYANFLILNDMVLLPIYKSKKDNEALEILKSVFPEREIIPIDCNILIRQHGSLHCVTMQYPKGALNNE
jgi:agmatine/peptidylarginine deiminase